MNKLLRSTILISGILILVASCSVQYQRPQLDTDHLIRNALPADTTFDVTKLRWQDFYKDSVLCDLIDSALTSNFDIKIALSHIEQAAAYFKQSKWAIAPNLGADVSASYSKSSLVDPKSPYFSVGISASWEIDIWGKLTKAKRAKYEQLLSQENTKNAVVTRLVADIAQSYYTLVTLDIEREFVLETIENRRNYLQTVRTLKESAQVNEVAVLQAESQLYSVLNYLYDIDDNIYRAENSLSLLLGKVPGPIYRKQYDNISNVVFGIDSLGIPANLLSNRPDVMAAENALKSSLHSYNSATAALYPSLTLTGNISSDATQINNWFAMPASLIWGVVGGLVQPILNGRQLRTQKDIAYQEFEISSTQFKETVLQAGIEVSNALHSFKSNKAKSEFQYKQYLALDKAYQYSVQLLINGYANYLDVLTAQNGVFNAQIDLIEGIQDCINNQIELYRALGGGWSKK